MALTSSQQIKVRAALHRAYSAAELPIAVTKPEADAAITDTDSYIDSIASAYNLALPLAYRQNATADDKAILFIVVAMAQQLVGNPQHLSVIQNIAGQMRGISEA